MFLRKSQWMSIHNAGNKGGGPVVVPLGLFTGGSVQGYAPAAGTTNNVNPGGAWPSANIGRIAVNTAAGAATFSGLVAATVDGQGVMITNLGPNSLTLENQNAGSTAANQFQYVGDLTLLTGDSVIAVYNLATGFWQLSS